jgi:PAS domain S-box-containing protein
MFLNIIRTSSQSNNAEPVPGQLDQPGTGHPNLMIQKQYHHLRQILGRTPYLLALFCIAALICGLLAINYRSQHSLQQANIQRLQQDLQGHATGISYFFSERENDTRYLADSKSVTGFFSNRDLGMTMAYGLRASLNDVTRFFANHMESSRISKDQIYTQLLLLDKNGHVLSRWPAGDQGESQPVSEEAVPQKPKVLITSYASGMISFTAPVIVNENLKGFVQGWVNYGTIIRNLLADTDGLLFVTDHGRLVFQSAQGFSLRVDTLGELYQKSSDWPFELHQGKLMQQTGTKHEQDTRWTVFSAVIPGYDLNLLLGEKSSFIANRQNLYLFMTVLAILSVGVFLVATMILRASTKNLVLETSLAEAEKREKAIAEKKEELELIIDGTRLGTWNWDIPSGEMIINNRWAEMLGYTPDELTANIDTWKKLIHPEDLDQIMRTLQAHLEGKTPTYTAVHRLRHKQGNWIWVHSAGKILKRNHEGVPLQALGIHLDISEQKEAQQLLNKAKEESDAIIRNFLDTLIVVNKDLTVARANQATCQLLGYRENELIGKPITLFFHEPEEMIAKVFSFYAPELTDTFNDIDELRNLELCYKSKDGDRLPMSFNINLLRDDSGSITGVVAGAKDISRLKAAMESVARQKEYIETLFQVVPEGLLAIAPSMDIIEHNQSFSEIIHNLATLFKLPENTVIREIQDKLQVLLPHTKHSSIALTHANSTVYLKYDATSVSSIKGIQYVVSISDITSEREAEAAQRLLATVVEQTTDSVIITETDGTIRYVNPATLVHTGYTEEDLIGKQHNIFDTEKTSAATAQELRATLADGRIWAGHLTSRRKDESVIEEDVTISPVRNEDGELIHFVAVKRDKTEIAILQRQLLQAQKLEAIGQLAAGIAHEINTPMQYVKNNVTFLAESFSDLAILLNDYRQFERSPDALLGEEARNHLQQLDLEFLLEEIPEALKESQEGINRVVKIVAAMKEFSHPGTGQKVETDINRILENTITVTRNEWKYVAEMVTDLAPDLPLIPCLPDQLKQVVLNLIINGSQAMETNRTSDSGMAGRITISTRQENDCVEIRVSDTGCGIPKEIRERVYDPFFTTKEVGKGTGQGLTIIHDIVVKKHGGTIDFTSEIGQGTTFFIRLPITSNDSKPET